MTHDLLAAYFADVIRTEATDVLRNASVTPREEARLRLCRATKTSQVLSVGVVADRVQVVARLSDGTTHSRSFDIAAMLDHLGLALGWAASRERDEWANLPAVGE